MHVKTVLNKKFIRQELVWLLRTNLNQLNQRLVEQGRAANYLYQLTDEDKPDVDVQLSTVDAIYNVAVDRYAELGQPAPDDLWERLVVHQII